MVVQNPLGFEQSVNIDYGSGVEGEAIKNTLRILLFFRIWNIQKLKRLANY
jgi:hypothetical protein